MKRTFLLLILFTVFLSSHGQYWQQRVNYLMDVTLNDKEKTLDGFAKITYVNHSPDTLHYIWFH
ncbi:MAG TPA: M1 family peptidase, partial [Flavisolibacter sp.]|nr:M1 family peptidase [Flavisolibacter sp.]